MSGAKVTALRLEVVVPGRGTYALTPGMVDALRRCVAGETELSGTYARGLLRQGLVAPVPDAVRTGWGYAGAEEDTGAQCWSPDERHGVALSCTVTGDGARGSYYETGLLSCAEFTPLPVARIVVVALDAYEEKLR